MANHISQILSFFTLIVNIILLLFILLFLYGKIRRRKVLLVSFFERSVCKHYILFAFIISLSAMLGSLYYSDYLGYNLCRLCWWQRIFIYPQSFLFGIALFIKDRKIAIYSVFLSIIGAIIAGFHYWIQISNSESFSCDVVGYSISCTEKFFLEFGYITIPIMSLTVFFLLIIFGFYGMKNSI